MSWNTVSQKGNGNLATKGQPTWDGPAEITMEV